MALKLNGEFARYGKLLMAFSLSVPLQLTYQCAFKIQVLDIRVKVDIGNDGGGERKREERGVQIQ